MRLSPGRFGGKSRAAHLIWERFGNVHHYVEPFFGSGAVLLRRPTPPRVETVNDADAYLANFWRAVQQAPGEIARHADWPVNEADLYARHLWLVKQTGFREQMRADPDFFDPKIAGWWVWGLSCWIGSGWCRSGDRDASEWSVRPDLSADGRGIHVSNKRPHLIGNGQGVGVHRVHDKIPEVGGLGGKGIHRIPDQTPQLSWFQGSHSISAPSLIDWFCALQSRLRRVRVTCGDWSRILTPAVVEREGQTVGILLDPPYSDDERTPDLYAKDAGTIARRVREWALAHGEAPNLRIALCGYEGEHEMPPTWEKIAWSASEGYGSSGKHDNPNKHRERIWFSPHCIRGIQQGRLF